MANTPAHGSGPLAELSYWQLAAIVELPIGEQYDPVTDANIDDCSRKERVADGIRTHDLRNHNPTF